MTCRHHVTVIFGISSPCVIVPLQHGRHDGWSWGRGDFGPQRYVFPGDSLRWICLFVEKMLGLSQPLRWRAMFEFRGIGHNGCAGFSASRITDKESKAKVGRLRTLWKAVENVSKDGGDVCLLLYPRRHRLVCFRCQGCPCKHLPQCYTNSLHKCYTNVASLRLAIQWTKVCITEQAVCSPAIMDDQDPHRSAVTDTFLISHSIV